MRFLLSEYVNLLKEDGELDTLITDLLVAMKCVTISKPQRGRQYGVDIAAEGIDVVDSKKKIFLFAVKQGNLTRSTWDGNINAVRSSLNQIRDSYIPISLPKTKSNLPIKIVVATNGVINQNVLVDWAQYINQNSTDDIEYDFWGTGELSAMLDEYLISEKLFPTEYQSLLRKTLAFLDLPDYNLSHFFDLLDLIFSKQFKQKRQIQKKLRLARLCLNILYKWSHDINNLKPAIYGSERTVLRSWHFLQSGNHLDKKFVSKEFYQIYLLKRAIGINYFNKVHKHYQTEHSLYRYSRNSLEYGLNLWHEIGIISEIGLSEIQQFKIYFREEKKEDSLVFYNSATSIANALCMFIANNPPAKYPNYDEHGIEIALALQLLCLTNNTETAKIWIRNLIVGYKETYHIQKTIPLFIADYDRLVDIINGDEKCNIDSSMIIPILAEHAIILEDADLYELIRKVVEDDVFKDLNLQIWFPTRKMEESIFKNNYSKVEGKLKHSVTLYKNLEEYRTEIISEVELYSVEKEFKVVENGFDNILFTASRHYRGQPFPYTWRKFIKLNTKANH
ncbi:hypothetical protein D9O36_09940 [Zobellia amurskyensis]|uniref:Restriction endonuclease n=1 Tax=Zobellia amurskyensis TaxID=248905 RepID=A0A7X2ZTL5_9FLAO|nr:hypothetical protein [Zobellia amurskyensis]MUH36163.1 hypothetical protein [Zobellia amurskyensis]